jgi:hypothetical protein
MIKNGRLRNEPPIARQYRDNDAERGTAGSQWGDDRELVGNQCF